MSSRFVPAAVLAVLVASTVRAQPAPPEPPRLDVTGSVGWLASDRQPASALGSDPWLSRWTFDVGAGMHWTENLITEIDVAHTSTGRVYLTQPVRQPGMETYIFSTDQVRDDRVGVRQLYQFGRNAWVHPFVGAGIAVTREWRQRSFQVFGPGTAPPPSEGTRVWVAPEFTGGVKFYVSPRVFIRTDATLAPTRTVVDATFRAGIGVDLR